MYSRVGKFPQYLLEERADTQFLSMLAFPLFCFIGFLVGHIPLPLRKNYLPFCICDRVDRRKALELTDPVPAVLLCDLGQVIYSVCEPCKPEMMIINCLSEVERLR